MKDIETEEDIQLMVNRFYDKVNHDTLLSPVFNDFAGVNWDDHLPKMYLFWNAMILGKPGYNGKPFPPHAALPIHTEHFSRWLDLFIKNIDEKFSGANAEMTKEKARNIAGVFQYKLGILK